MKTLFTLVLSILSAALFAQLNIGDIYLGGGICLETESVSSTFGGSTTDGPSTNYFSLSTYGQLAITNNITVGGGLGFESESGSSTDEFSTGDFSSNLFMAKGAARHWTTCGGPDSPVKPFVQAEIAAGFGKSESSFESGGENFTSTDDLFNFRAGLRAGIYYDLNKHWGLTLSTGRTATGRRSNRNQISR
jgi:hypothetical protein